MRPTLFVYGTLMRSSRHPMAERLAAEADFLGLGHVRGELFDLGKWPGLVLRTEDRYRVHGEVWRLRHARSLVWLDLYEGIGGGRLNPEYERVGVRVTLDDGEAVEAFAYIYRWSLVEAPRIPNGRWLPEPVGARANYAASSAPQSESMLG